MPGLDIPGYPLSASSTVSAILYRFRGAFGRSHLRPNHDRTDIVVEKTVPPLGSDGAACVPTGTVRVFRAVDRILHGCKFVDLRVEYCGSHFTIHRTTQNVDAAAFRRDLRLCRIRSFSIRPHQHVSDGACGDVRRASALTICYTEYICDANDNYFFRGMDYCARSHHVHAHNRQAIHDDGGSPNGGCVVLNRGVCGHGEVYRRNVELWKGCSA